MSDKIIKGLESSDMDTKADALEYSVVGLSGLVKPQVLEANLEARALLQQARGEAAEIVGQAHKVLAAAEAERESERRRGYEEGHQEAEQGFTQRLVTLEQQYEQTLQGSEFEIVRMVMEIAEKVIGKELKTGAVVGVVKKALRESVGQRLVIFVNPKDRALLERKQQDLMQAVDGCLGISFKEDATLVPGGCVIETEVGTIDARLDVQLAAIRQALGLKSPDSMSLDSTSPGSNSKDEVK